MREGVSQEGVRRPAFSNNSTLSGKKARPVRTGFPLSSVPYVFPQATKIAMIWTVAIVSKLLILSGTGKGIEPVLRFKDSAGIDTVTVEIGARRVDLATLGRSVLSVKNTENSSSLANLLQREGVYLKSYGVSGSATISRRGADPTQTQILWNNLPICNPMLGMGDFTILMPVGMSVKLVEGGNATLLGSGSVGGSIALTSEMLSASQRSFNRGFVSIQSGSFGEYGITATAISPSTNRLNRMEKFNAQGSSRLSAAATVSYNRSENSFHFNDEGLSIINRVMNGSQVSRTLARTSIQYRGVKSQWVWHNEIAEVKRGLGVLLGSLTKLGTQYDQAFRTVIESNTQLNSKWKITHRLGWIRDYLEYNDGTNSGNPGSMQISIAQTLHLQSEWYYKANSQSLVLLGGDLQSQHADISSYESAVTRTLPAVFVAWHKVGDFQLSSVPWSWQRVITARYELKEKIPTASLSWVIKPTAAVAQVKFNVHTTFRRPTLNDLYWFIPITRPNLTFEQGLGTELAWQRKWTKHGSLEWLVYGRYLDKPIVWTPAGAFWMPVNLQGGGLYYGGQSKTKAYIWVHPTYGTWIWANQWERSISWVKSTSNAMAYHQIFIPNLSGKTTMIWQKKQWGAELGYAYTGKRFIQTDNKKYLPGFGLLQAEVNCQKSVRSMVFVFRLEGDNLLNVVYQTVPNRPMPGSSVRFTTTIRF